MKERTKKMVFNAMDHMAGITLKTFAVFMFFLAIVTILTTKWTLGEITMRLCSSAIFTLTGIKIYKN